MTLKLLDGCAAHVESATTGIASPPDRLRAAISAELEYFSTRRIEFLAMAEVLANHRDEHFTHAFHDVAGDETAALGALLVDEQNTGQFRTFGTTEFAHLIMTAKSGVLDRWAADGSLDLTLMTAALLDFVEAAIVKS